jgi:hypothetical protein
MVRQDRPAEQINAKVPSLMNQLCIEPDLTVIKILPGDRVISEQETATHCAIRNMENCDLIRRKHFHTRQSSYDLPPRSGKFTTPEYLTC